MDNTAREWPLAADAEDDLGRIRENEPTNQPVPIDAVAPIHLDFVSEIEVWARRALASNGFGDF